MARPSKLTPETHAAIVDAILHGATYKDAAESAGVWYETFNNWIKLGEASKSGQYFQFFQDVRKAEAQCRLNMTRVIQSAVAKGDWKAAEAYLRRRDRANWGDNVDVTSNGESVKPIDDERFNRAISTLADAVREGLSRTGNQ